MILRCVLKLTNVSPINPKDYARGLKPLKLHPPEPLIRQALDKT
jgi:hypothetical protein